MLPRRDSTNKDLNAAADSGANAIRDFSGLYHRAVTVMKKKKKNNHKDSKRDAPDLGAQRKTLSEYLGLSFHAPVVPLSNIGKAENLRVKILVVDDNEASVSFFVKELIEKQSSTWSNYYATVLSKAVSSAGTESSRSANAEAARKFILSKNSELLKHVTVTTTNNGRDGLKHLRNESFDVVFVSLNVPMVYGFAQANKSVRSIEVQSSADAPIPSDLSGGNQLLRLFKEHLARERSYIDIEISRMPSGKLQAAGGKEILSEGEDGGKISVPVAYSGKQQNAAGVETLRGSNKLNGKTEGRSSITHGTSTKSYTRTELKSGTHVLTKGTSLKGSSTSTYTPSKDFSIISVNPDSYHSEIEDSEDDDSVINEHALVIGIGDPSLVTEEQISAARRHIMHYYCTLPMDVVSLYAILGAVDCARKLNDQSEASIVGPPQGQSPRPTGGLFGGLLSTSGRQDSRASSAGSNCDRRVLAAGESPHVSGRSVEPSSCPREPAGEAESPSVTQCDRFDFSKPLLDLSADKPNGNESTVRSTSSITLMVGSGNGDNSGILSTGSTGLDTQNTEKSQQDCVKKVRSPPKTVYVEKSKYISSPDNELLE